MQNAFPHWSRNGESGPYLIGTQCRECDLFHFPPSGICRNCLNDDMEIVHFGKVGTLYSFSVIHVSSMGFQAPYVIGYVDLDHGIRMYSLIIDWQGMDLKNGAKMELVISVIKRDENGNDVEGYAFRPVKQNESIH